MNVFPAEAKLDLIYILFASKDLTASITCVWIFLDSWKDG